jgi:hypothetical protein
VRTLPLVLTNGQSPPQHKACRRHVDERLTRRRKPLVILAHPAVLAQPREGALHYPPRQEGSEALSKWEKRLPIYRHPLLAPFPGPRLHHLLRSHFRRVSDDLCCPAQSLLYPVGALVLTVVACVYPQLRGAETGPSRAPTATLSLHDPSHPLRGPSLEHQSLRVYQKVALVTLDLLAAVIATLFSAHPGRFDRLAVDYPGARLRVPLETDLHPLAQSGVHPLPGAVQTPDSEVVETGFQGGKSCGKKRQAHPLRTM